MNVTNDSMKPITYVYYSILVFIGLITATAKKDLIVLLYVFLILCNVLLMFQLNKILSRQISFSSEKTCNILIFIESILIFSCSVLLIITDIVHTIDLIFNIGCLVGSILAVYIIIPRKNDDVMIVPDGEPV